MIPRIECRVCGERYPEQDIAVLYGPVRVSGESGVCVYCYRAPECCPQCAAPVDEDGLCSACWREVTA